MNIKDWPLDSTVQWNKCLHCVMVEKKTVLFSVYFVLIQVLNIKWKKGKGNDAKSNPSWLQ
jgi:hypothetical protein